MDSTHTSATISGPVALVTGGTGGIGTAICQALARAGHRVAAAYNKQGDHQAAQRWQQEQQSLGFHIDIFHGDISQDNSTEQLVRQVQEKLGSIEVLVNNAGITKDSTLKKMSLADWEAVIQTNLSSLFHITKRAIEDMLKKGYGRIINISSVNGQKGQFGQTNYAAAKAGMHGFTKSLAQEVARKGITVNTVSPGYINTSMMKNVPEEVLKSILDGIPMGRLGTPEEVAHVVAFLAQPQSGYITGANFSVNGGQHMF